MPNGRVYYDQFRFVHIQTKDQEDNWQVGNDFSPDLWSPKSWMLVGPHTLYLERKQTYKRQSTDLQGGSISEDRGEMPLQS